MAESFSSPAFENKAKAYNTCYAFDGEQANSEYCLDFFFLLHAMMWTWLSLLQSHLGRGLRINRKKKENLSASIHLSLAVTVGRM